MADQKKGPPRFVPPKMREFKAWMEKKHPGLNYLTVERSMRRNIFNQWKEYLRQSEVDKIREPEYKGKWITSKEFDNQTATHKLRVASDESAKRFADANNVKTKLNPNYRGGTQTGKWTQGKYLYEPVTPELVLKIKKSLLRGNQPVKGPFFEEEFQRKKDLGQKLIDDSRKNPNKKKWIITKKDLNKALTKLKHPITGKQEISFSDRVLAREPRLFPDLTKGHDYHSDPLYREVYPKSTKTDAVLSRIRKRILDRVSGLKTERILPAIKRGTPFSAAVHILHTTSKRGQEYLTIEDLALGSEKQNLAYASKGPDGLDTLRNKMQLFLRRLAANHGHKGPNGEVKLNPGVVKQWNLPKATWKFGELADRFNLALSDMAMATDGQVRGNLLDIQTLEMKKNPFKGNVGQLIGAGTLGDLSVKELDESLGKLELQAVDPETGIAEGKTLKYTEDGSLKFKNKFYLRDAKGELLKNPDGTIKWALDPAKVTGRDLDRIQSIVLNMKESLPQAAEGKPLSLSGLATKTENPVFINLLNKLVGSGTTGGPVCNLDIIKAARGGKAPGGVIGPDCSSQVKQVIQENPDQLIKEAAAAKVKSGESTGFRNIARQILSKIPKGGRLGAILAGAGAVGAGTWAMTGGAKAEEAPTTDQMTYNATEGKFVQPNGDPESQEGISKLDRGSIQSNRHCVTPDTGWYRRRFRSRCNESRECSKIFSRA